MRKFFVLIIFSPVFVSAQDSSAYFISGKLKNIKDPVQKVYLSYSIDHHSTMDSMEVRDDSYSFKGWIKDPINATLKVRYQSSDPLLSELREDRDILSFFIEPGAIKITHIDSFGNAKITAGKANSEFRKLEKKLKPYDDQETVILEKYQEAEKNKDLAMAGHWMAEFETMDSTVRERIYLPYLKKENNSPIALYVLKLYGGIAMDAQKMEPVFNGLSDQLRNSTSGKRFWERIEIAKKTAIGMTAMDFTQPDTSGKPVSLSSFRGKYVFLNFWASWCPHCKRENPNIVEAFNKYKTNPFTILSVCVISPDQKEQWLNAIHEFHLDWTHVSDLGKWQNAVVKQYDINGIPQNFLIDPEGKIIARNLIGPKLDKKLAEIFSKK